MTPAPARFHRDDILDAAQNQVFTHGHEVTIQQIAKTAGAPVGSIYHRFTSRDQLLAELWVRSVNRFHAEYLDGVDVDAITTPAQAQVCLSSMAATVVRHVRTAPENAAAMTLFRQRVLQQSVTGPLRREVASINVEVEAVLLRLGQVRFARRDERHTYLVRVAAIDLPYGLVRPYVRSSAPPEELEDIARVAANATLALGD